MEHDQQSCGDEQKCGEHRSRIVSYYETSIEEPGEDGKQRPYEYHPSSYATNQDFLDAEQMMDFDWPDGNGGAGGSPTLATQALGYISRVLREVTAPLRGRFLPLTDDDRRAAALPFGVSAAGIARKIEAGGIKKIVVMCGAGISTAAGIADFRSPDKGLYHKLMEYDIPRPEVVLTLEYFRQNPRPFYQLVKKMYPGNRFPTKSHYFVKMLENRGMLQRLYTQNIDTFERQAGISPEYLVEAHGTFATAHCVKCGIEFPAAEVREAIFDDRVPHCHECHGVVKPDLVLFDERLPLRFFKLRDEDFAAADLLIVLGTSLTVEPFASCIAKVSPFTPRLLINNDVIGRGKWSKTDRFAFGEADNYRDVLMQTTCDDGIGRLATLLGWSDELDSMVEQAKNDWESEHEAADLLMTPSHVGSVIRTTHGSVLHMFDDGSSPIPLPIEDDEENEPEHLVLSPSEQII